MTTAKQAYSSRTGYPPHIETAVQNNPTAYSTDNGIAIRRINNSEELILSIPNFNVQFPGLYAQLQEGNARPTAIDADVHETSLPISAVFNTPSTNVTSAGNLNLTTTVPGNVTKVEYYKDGALLYTSNTGPTFTYTFVVSAAINGKHSFYSKAYDASGNNKTSAPVTIKVAI